MASPNKVRSLVDEKVVEFSTEPRIAVNHVDLNDLGVRSTGTARPSEPSVPANIHFFRRRKRTRPWNVKVDPRIDIFQMRVAEAHLLPRSLNIHGFIVEAPQRPHSTHGGMSPQTSQREKYQPYQ